MAVYAAEITAGWNDAKPDYVAEKADLRQSIGYIDGALKHPSLFSAKVRSDLESRLGYDRWNLRAANIKLSNQ